MRNVVRFGSGFFMAVGSSVRYGRVRGASVILRVDDSVIGTLGNFSASTGKGKEQEDVQRLRNRGGSHDGRHSVELFGLFAAGEAAHPLRRYGAEPFPLQAGVVPDSAADGIARRYASAVVGVLVPARLCRKRAAAEDRGDL